jgi:trk system potassium uptake protein TrkH
MVLHVTGLSMTVLGVGMLASGVVEVIDRGPDPAPLLLCAAATLVAGSVVWWRTTTPSDVQILDVFITVAVAWVALTVVGAIPYLATGRLTAPDQALFESISGFTTTGATVLRPISDTSQGLLFYRALTQWIGGMGVIVLVIAVLPSVGSGGMSLMQAEAPGPVGERLTPRVRETARILWLVYLGLTVAVAGAYMVAGMSLFDGATHSFTTVSTGGFSPHNQSLAHFDSAAIEWIAAVSMLFAGGSFTLYYRALRGKPGSLWQSTEVRAYLALVLIATATLFAFADTTTSRSEHARDSFLTITSIVSTTGFATADFGLWSPGTQAVILLLLPIGAMAGSTAGGVKIVRVLAVASWAHRAALRHLHPRLVRPVRVGNQTVPEDVASRIVGFMILALAVFGGGALLIALTGPDLTTAFSAAATSFGNVGPGLGQVGPSGDFLALPSLARVVAMGQMLLGRLEIYPLLLALAPITLRRRWRTTRPN